MARARAAPEGDAARGLLALREWAIPYLERPLAAAATALDPNSEPPPEPAPTPPDPLLDRLRRAAPLRSRRTPDFVPSGRWRRWLCSRLA
ncbi:MAG: hypothetical protein R2909_14865 [Gemmatimonadales bacterium]